MKKTIYALCGFILSLSLCFTSKANSGVSNTVCFNDGFYNWKITYTSESGGSYTASGTVNVDGVDWTVYGSGAFANRMGTVEFHAANPNGDNCQGAYVDSFTYYGSAQISGNGTNTTFTGSGNWVNYCAGSELFYGSWSAYGPCGASLQTKPYGPAKNKANPNALTGQNGTNTVCFNDGFYNWKITYTDQGGGNYSASGSVNVDGVDWWVYGSGSFANRMGTVEFHASNPNGDNCQGAYVDSFTYYGSAQISGNGTSTTFTGGGNWVNYCAGSELFYGSWAASGPCGASLQTKPYGPAKNKENPNAITGKNGTNTVCFNDGFYNWNITYTDQGWGNYSAKGTVNVDGVDWTVYGSGSFANRMGTVEFHAANPNGDNCQGAYVDSFTYYGSAQISGNGSSTTFSGSGNWVNYCAGSELFYGSWAAYGPCGASLKSQPYGPAKNTSKNVGDKKPMNTVCFTDGWYNWKVTYTDQGGGSYSASGTVSVDGIDWIVSGSGDFANHAGNVELTATNPNADGCNSGYTDYFTYFGTAQISGTGPGTTFWGSGNWVSYCSGSMYGTGTWSASGPCSNSLKSVPYGPAKSVDVFSLKVAPNPVKNTSTLSYDLLKESQVKITVFNYMQQPVKVVVNKKESAGNHRYVIDGSSLTNGSYRVVAVVDGRSYTYPLQVVK